VNKIEGKNLFRTEDNVFLPPLIKWVWFFSKQIGFQIKIGKKTSK